ncbi:uncharacterized protein LOC124810893 isoform X2 [Hydra vulgaris]|nr:uncharacterized protein LOC124810893 isoform X1 [Hydra vulgaris]
MKLRFGKDLDKELHQWMKGMEDKILTMIKLKCKDGFISKIFAEIECEIDESTKKDATLNGAILMLPRLFKESVEALVTFDNTSMLNTPTIAIPQGQKLTSKFCCVIIDGQEIVEHHNDVDISLGMACIFASYFVYNIKYPVQLKNTLLFYEHIIFGVSNKEIPVTYRRLANTLYEV